MSFDHIGLLRDLQSSLENEPHGEVTLRWWTNDGRRYVEISQVASWKPTSQTTVSSDPLLPAARELDAKWRSVHSKPISSERLARQLRIRKQRAIALANQVRSEVAQ
jgi:hypothetical protein